MGVLIGTQIGVQPGLGPSGAIAILLPTTFNIPAASAIIMLSGIFYGAMYGGSITSILVNIPGEAASVVTCIDGYQMARHGRAGAALGISAFGSFIAAIFGILVLAFLAPFLANVALNFGPAEYFSIMILGLTLVTYLGSGSMLKALMMAVLGLIVGCVGTDPILGTQRLTYGIEALFDGIGIIPVVMGLFGLSEVLLNIEVEQEKRQVYETRIDVKGLLPTRDDWRKSAMPITRGSIIGFLIGIIPGGGAVISSFASYAVEKKFSRHPERFGKGAIEGVAGPESANNSATMGCMVPLLTLGIPSNAVMAMLLAALMIHGTPPGPLLIQNHPALFWGVIISMVMGNFLLLVFNVPLIGMWVKVLKVPYNILFPLIILFCLIGVYSVSSMVVDIVIMLVFGWVGYLMKKYEFEGAPLILAFVLGPMMETNLRRALIISGGNFGIFISHPISLVCLVTALLFILFPVFSLIRRKRKLAAA
ncbi:MAG: tripartite tricarboxylate transporter permease [Syntrophales bacterium]|nr:tripartite tricarboxylate transporter permease [Syntrophales bacterium]